MPKKVGVEERVCSGCHRALAMKEETKPGKNGEVCLNCFYKRRPWKKLIQPLWHLTIFAADYDLNELQKTAAACRDTLPNISSSLKAKKIINNLLQGLKNALTGKEAPRMHADISYKAGFDMVIPVLPENLKPELEIILKSLEGTGKTIWPAKTPKNNRAAKKRLMAARA